MDRRSVLQAAGATLLAGQVPAAAASAAFEPRSRLALPGAKEAVVGPDGGLAYVATTDGFATVDVGDPDDPAVLAERRALFADRDEGPMRKVQDVAVEGTRLAVAGPASGDGVSGVVLYDVSDPAAPRRLGFHETDFAIHNCDLSGTHVYLTGNDGKANPLVVVEASDDGPREVGRWSLYDVDDAWQDVHLNGRPIHDVTVADGVACCAYWDAGTWLLDVSDPAAPETLGQVGGFTAAELLAMTTNEKAFEVVEPPGNAHYAEVGDDGRVLAVGGESWDARGGDGHGGPSGIDLWDVSDPADPTHRSTIDPVVPRDATREGTWTTAHNFELTGGRLYSSWYQDGVKVHDVSDPGAPELLAHWRDPAATRFWTARLGRPGAFFVASDMGARGNGGDDAGLYCFPDRAGTQADQPAIETATPPPTASPTRARDHTATATRTPRPTRTPSDSPAATGATTARGFGPLVAAGALGVAAWRRLRRGRDA
jgi:hypothetical protein